MAHNGCSQYRVRGHCDCCLQADNVFAAGKEEHSHLDPTLYTRVRVRVSKKTTAMSKKGVIVLGSMSMRGRFCSSNVQVFKDIFLGKLDALTI